MVYWKGLSKFVREYVRNFVVYQKNNYESMTSPETLQPFSVLEGIFTNITMDFIEALPKSNGKTVIMVVVDRFTTYAHLIGLQHPYSAKTVARFLIMSTSYMVCPQLLLVIETHCSPANFDRSFSNCREYH